MGAAGDWERDLRCRTGEEAAGRNGMKINKIKEARLAAGLTQKSMSEKTGIPMRTIGDWETGHRRPSDWVAALVIEKLNRIKQENAAAK